MGDTLEALHRLQKAELELHHLRDEINSRRRALRSIQRRVSSLDQQIAAKRDQIKHLRAAADRAELEIRTREADITKLREALNKAKTNKEYAAILTQLNTSKADMSRMEERVLQQLAQVDAARKELEGLQENRDREQDRLARETESTEAFEQARAGDLQRLQSERQQVAEIVPPTALRDFERVSERHDGEAMAVIERPDPRRQEYACGGCHMSIPLDVINSIHARDDLQHCGTCGRILYLDQAAGRKKR